MGGVWPFSINLMACLHVPGTVLRTVCSCIVSYNALNQSRQIKYIKFEFQTNNIETYLH